MASGEVKGEGHGRIQKGPFEGRSRLRAGLAVSAGLMGASVLPGCAPSKAAPSEAGPTSGGTDAPTGGSGNPNAGYETGIDWLGTPPEIADADVTATFDGDIVVCGGGNAGIQAALAAAEGGAKVHVLETAPEKFRKVKGRDVGHVNSQWLIDQGSAPMTKARSSTSSCTAARAGTTPR